MNAQLHVEDSVFPETARGGNGDNGETQAFSNFVLQESNERHNDFEPSTAIIMT